MLIERLIQFAEPQQRDCADEAEGRSRVRVSALNRFNNSFLSRDPQRGSNRQTCNADQDNVACILITKRLFGCCGNIGDLVPQIMLLAASTLQYCFTGAFRLLTGLDKLSAGLVSPFLDFVFG